MNERQLGTVKEYKRDRGFGFIRPDAGGSDVFVHATVLQRHQRLPKAGDRISYVVTHDERGRLRARNARLTGLKLSWNVQTGLACWYSGFLLLLFGLLGNWFPLGGPLMIYLCVMLIMGPVTFEAYGIDKHRAECKKTRIPEAIMHVLELCGGWPGALFAQHMFRHKLQKRRYQIIYSMIVSLNLIGLYIMLGWV